MSPTASINEFVKFTFEEWIHIDLPAKHITNCKLKLPLSVFFVISISLILNTWWIRTGTSYSDGGNANAYLMTTLSVELNRWLSQTTQLYFPASSLLTYFPKKGSSFDAYWVERYCRFVNIVWISWPLVLLFLYYMRISEVLQNTNNNQSTIIKDGYQLI